MILFLFLLVFSLRVVMKKCSSSGQEEAAGATVQCNELRVDVPLPQANTFPKDLDHRDVAMSLNSCTDKQDSIRESHASLEELWPSSEPESTPFVPFFGDGQRLGDSSVAVPSLGLYMPSSKLPTTFSSPGGPSKPKKSKNSQELQKEQEQLVEREPLVCHLDLLEPLPAGPEELPDEFFEVTVDDVRKRLAQLQSERQVPFLLETPGRSSTDDKIFEGGSDEGKVGALPKGSLCSFSNLTG
ncbi:hypothetical protein QYF61_022987 [Mycteria americana]|uniref:Uncharacterized protein n=1 Tax=Mycteria americana TaxID=33587 RepID=A0AAN7MUR0_MYCAM|nr:hypothetical protein QYF61_022987 [Mycteria americana]